MCGMASPCCVMIRCPAPAPQRHLEATRLLIQTKVTCPLISAFSFFFLSPLLFGCSSSVAVFCFNQKWLLLYLQLPPALLQ